MSLQCITGLDEELATNMLVYLGDVMMAPLQVHTSWYNLLLFGIASCDDDIWSDTSTSCAMIASLWWMLFAGLYGHENSQDPHCARSQTGYVISAFGCPVVWRSSLQTAIALSTMEAEYVALSTACKDLIPVVGLVRDLSEAVGMDSSFNAKLHIKIHKDNVGALTLARLEPA